jgi:negative regulator of sigma E activity
MTDDPIYDQHAEDDASARRSYIALAFVAVVVAAGVWLVSSFREHNRTIECLETGHHNCVPLDTSVKGPGG